jgi:hypothetical protein
MNIETRAAAQAFLDDLMKFAQVPNQLTNLVFSRRRSPGCDGPGRCD